MSDHAWRAGLLRVGATTAIAYVAAQLVQRWILLELPVATSAIDRAALRVDPLNLVRLWSIFASFLLLPFFVAAVVANVREARRALAAIGGVFFLVFILVELLYRSVELMAVSGWVRHLLSEPDPTRRLILEYQIAAFDQSVHAWYFVLMASQLIGSVILSLAVHERTPWNLVVSLMFGLNAVRLLFRMLESYAGLTWLQPTNSVAYTPAVSLFFLTVAFWLWRTAARSQS